MNRTDDGMPSRLFHYTTQRGLLGIAGSKALWATNIRYLSDSEEFNHAATIAAEVAGDYWNRQRGDPAVAEFLMMLGDRIPTVGDEEHIFVCSFSEVPDLLSQWRAYSTPGNAFCLGFSVQHLQRLGSGWRLQKCNYDPDAHRQQMERIIGVSIEAVKGRKGSEAMTAVNAEIEKVVAQMTILAPAMKHPSFEEEREWRLVSGRLNPELGWQFRFRPGRYSLIPYVEMDLRDREGNIGLIEVLVGPTEHREVSLNAVISMLLASKVEGVRVFWSQTPFREW